MKSAKNNITQKEGKYLIFLKIALKVCSELLSAYSHPKSKHTYKFPSLIACVLLKIYIVS